MPLLLRTCVVLTCDLCDDGWADLDAEPHFSSRGEATEYAVSAGWLITGSRAVCASCAHVAACALAGHDWGAWAPAGPFPSAAGGAWQGRVRHCRRCSAADWDPPLARRRGFRRNAG